MEQRAAVEVELRDGGCGLICTEVLETVPEWFGIPEANADYASAAERNPTVVAMVEGQPVGLTTLLRHSEEAAEVYLMAVARAHHRRGIGAAMLSFVEERLAEDGVTFLQVKTLADSSPDPNYAKTREFYLSTGFVPLEVFPTLWDPSNPALQLIKSLR